MAGTHSVPHSFAFIDHWTLYIVPIVNFTTAHYAYLRVSIASLGCDALAFSYSAAADGSKSFPFILSLIRNCPTQTKLRHSRSSPATIGIPFFFQSRYFVEINDLEWPSQPIPATAHGRDSHVLQKVIDKLGPTVKTSHT